MSEIKLTLMDDGLGYLVTEEEFEIVIEATKALVQKPDFRDNYNAYLSRRKMLRRIASHPNNGNKVRIDASLMADSLKMMFYSRYGKCNDVPSDRKAIDHSKGPLTEQCRVKPTAAMLKLGEKFSFKPQALVKHIRHYYAKLSNAK